MNKMKKRKRLEKYVEFDVGVGYCRASDLKVGECLHSW